MVHFANRTVSWCATCKKQNKKSCYREHLLSPLLITLFGSMTLAVIVLLYVISILSLDDCLPILSRIPKRRTRCPDCVYSSIARCFFTFWARQLVGLLSNNILCMLSIQIFVKWGDTSRFKFFHLDLIKWLHFM